MNSVILIGRLTKDVKTSQSNDTKIATYAMAIDRFGEGTDFVNIVAFGKQAEFAEKYFQKGLRVGVQGRIRTGSYTNKDEKKVYTTDIVADRQEFADGKKEKEDKPAETYIGFTEGDESELPFN